MSTFMSSGVLHLGIELPGLPSLCVCLPSPTWAVYVATGLPFYHIRLPSFPWGCVCHPLAACSPPFINVGFHTSALGCLHRCEQPYLGVHLPSSAWVRTSALGCQHHCGLLYFGVGSSSLDVGPYLIIWPFILVVGASSSLLGRSFFFVRPRVVIVVSLCRCHVALVVASLHAWTRWHLGREGSVG